MVGNYERLAELSEEAADSEDAALIQQLKTMDSIKTKLNQLKVTFQEFYTSSGVEDLIKGILDFVTRIINTMNSMPKLFGKIPAAAIGVVAQIIGSLKNLSTKLLGVVDNLAETLAKKIKEAIHDGVDGGLDAAENEINKHNEKTSNNKKPKTEAEKKREAWTKSKGAKALGIGGAVASAVGTVLTSAGIMTATGSNRKSGWMQVGGAITSIGGAVASGAATGGLPGAIIGGIIGIIGQIPTLISAFGEFTETTEEKIARLKESSEKATEEKILAKQEYQSLEEYAKKLKELDERKHDSNESYEEWLKLNNEVVSKYPELLGYVTQEGDKIAKIGEEWEIAKRAKEKYYEETKEEAIASLNYLTDSNVQFSEALGGANPYRTTAGRDPSATLFKKLIDEEIYDLSSILGEFDKLVDDAVNERAEKEQLYYDFFNYDEDFKNFINASVVDVYSADFGYNLMQDVISKIFQGYSLDDINRFLRGELENDEAYDSSIGLSRYNLQQLAQKGYSPQISGNLYESYRNLEYLGSDRNQEAMDKQIRSAIATYITSTDELNDSFEIESQVQMDYLTSDFLAKYQSWRKNNGGLSDDTIRAALGITDGRELGEGDLLKYYLEKGINLSGEIQSFLNSQDSLPKQIENLNEDKKRELDKIYLASSEYSLEQWIAQISKILNIPIEENSELYNWFKDQYDNATGDFYTSQKEWFESFIAGIEELEGISADKFSSNTLKSFNTLSEKGFDAEKLSSLIQHLASTDEQAALFASLVSKHDITSLSGLTEISSAFLGVDDTLAGLIYDLKDSLNINLKTEWYLFSEKLTTSLESLGEALNKASSGMNLKEAQEMASKLGVSITDFELVDGQFFYHDLKAIENAYLEQYSTLKQQLADETDSQIKSLGKEFNIKRSEADGINLEELDLTEENKTLFNTYFEDWKDAVDTGKFTGTFYQYVVEQLRQMEQENLDVTDKYLRQQVEQITRERLEQIYDTISNGISGSMSEGELSQLDYYLKENGHNFTLQTYETAEGLKLTEDSVLRVYEVLKQTDSLAAQVVLDELTESAMEAEEKFNNIYEVLEHIAELNREIEKAKGTAREDALRRELVLAENIRDTLIEAGNAFNFMNQDLPTEHTNPLSAWKGMGDAWKVLEGDDFKAGYIDYTDLYNMINMMESAGVDLEQAGFSFNGKALTASELMQAAGQALVNVDGETFVDLSKIGLDFELNAEQMKGGLMSGIRLIAESQIDLLDAEILFLETIVKTQKAFEALEGKDGVIDFSDINFLGIAESSWTKEQIESTKWIERLFSGILVTSELTVQDIINNPNSWQNLSLESQKFIALLYETVNQVFSSEDWTSDIGINAEILEQKMNAALAPYGYKFQIDSSFLTQNLSFNTGNLETEIEKKLEELGITNLNDELIQKIAQEIGKQIENGETITLMDIIQLLPEDQQVISLFGLGQAISIQNPEEIIVVEELQMAKVLKWGENSYQALYGEKSIGTYKTEEEAREALTYHSETNNKLLNGETVVETKVELEETGIFEVSLSSGEPTYEYNGFYYPSYEAANSARLEDLENKKLIEGTSASGGTTEVETSTKVVLKTDNITIGTENESGKAEIEIGEVIAHSSGVEISAKDGNVTFTVNGKEVEGPQFMAELGVVNLDNLNALITAVEKLEVPPELAADLETIASKLKTLGESLSDAQVKRIGDLASNLSKIQTSTKTLTVELSVSSTGSIGIAKVDNTTGAKGTVTNLSFATGNAKAAGTLMGELGPELYVTGGRYYVAGQNGAEFVNLPSDAIVFNHLQTRRLLENGSVNGTGKPVTNERNAVAMATGTTGPAKASASDALKELYEIRAMWQGLLDADASDFAKKAGSGGGSGGGREDDKAFMHELERWYNLLRQISKLEQQITYEQAKRENMQSGYKHVQSLEKELALLKKQQAAHQELSDLQRKYYDERRDVLKNTSYGELIFTYDEDGLMQYIEEDGKGLDILAELEETDENGKAVRTAEEQVAYLSSVGFDISTLLTNADGSKVKSNDYQTMMQIFWDGVDGWMAELDDLYDSYNESMTSVEEAIQAQNEIMQEYIDNQLSVEERLMEAIVSREEAEIERLEKELDALDEATNKYLDGLKDSLDREKQMYERNKDSEETAKLQRQLAILKRTGGSASEIQSLQDEISSRLEDSYFQQQEDQIDALEQAANNQIEKLQNQIDIMTESLEYQKANGLLWEEVYEMMNNWSPEQMLQFIEEFLPSYRENSALQNDQNSQEALKEFEIWVAKRENAEALANAWQNYYDSVDQYSDEFKAEHAEGAKNAYSLAYATEGEEAAKKAADDYFAKQAGLLNGSGGGDDEEKEEQPGTETTPIEGGGESSKKASQTSGEIKRGAKGEDVRAIQKALSSLGYYKGSIDGIFGEATQNAVYSFQKAMGIQADGIVGNKTREKFKLKGYKTGGLVDFTGPAWVDGTRTKPEAFLSAEDTAMLKSKIFDNNKFSLRSVVELFEGFNDSNRNITTNNDQGVVFENVQITIESGTISNDYDARRAGEMALEEMLKISRKTTNRIVSRR